MFQQVDGEEIFTGHSSGGHHRTAVDIKQGFGIDIYACVNSVNRYAEGIGFRLTNTNTGTEKQYEQGKGT